MGRTPAQRGDVHGSRSCDTNFVGTGGGKFAATTLAEAVAACWKAPGARGRPVVLPGGEPLLQVDAALIDALHARGFEVAVETNGTLEAPPGLDWICVSRESQYIAAHPARVGAEGRGSPARHQPGRADRPGLPASFAAADGRAAAPAQHTLRDRALPAKSALAADNADTQAGRHPVRFELSQRFLFDAAHTLRRGIETDSSARVHGHTYQAEVAVAGQPDAATGMVVDLGVLRAELERIRLRLDHHLLDEAEGLGPPTLENLCIFLARLATQAGLSVRRVCVWREGIGDRRELRVN